MTHARTKSVETFVDPKKIDAKNFENHFLGGKNMFWAKLGLKIVGAREIIEGKRM